MVVAPFQLNSAGVLKKECVECGWKLCNIVTCHSSMFATVGWRSRILPNRNLTEKNHLIVEGALKLYVQKLSSIKIQ